MKVLITGTASGIGYAVANEFLAFGHEVHGIDIKASDIKSDLYRHYIADVGVKSMLPYIPDVEILFINAGAQTGEKDIETNLIGAMNVTENVIATSKCLRSILFNASASSVSGQEFPYYVASKAGLVGYMRNVAIRLAPKQITCNAISLGGVYTDSNLTVIHDKTLWNAVMQVTPMKKWTSLKEVCEWVKFLTITNHSMSGQNLLIDNGEKDLNPTFVWPGYEVK